MYKHFVYNDDGFLADDVQEDEPGGNWFKHLVKIIIIFLLMLLVASVMGGCKSVRYVPVIEHRTDTVLITKHQRDSIFVHDSIHVKEKQSGDTVWLEVDRWHTRYIERETHDTLYVATHDTVPSPYPVPEYVEKQLSWWQQTRIHMGEALIAIIGIWLLWFFIKKKTAILTVIRAFVKL